MMRTDTGKVFVKLAKFRFALALVTLRKWSTELSLHKRKGFRFSTLSCRTEAERIPLLRFVFVQLWCGFETLQFCKVLVRYL